MGGFLQRRRWLDCIGLIASTGSPVPYWLDCIGWILSVSVFSLLGETAFYALAGLLMDGWDGKTGWDVGGAGVGWRD